MPLPGLGIIRTVRRRVKLVPRVAGTLSVQVEEEIESLTARKHNGGNQGGSNQLPQDHHNDELAQPYIEQEGADTGGVKPAAGSGDCDEDEQRPGAPAL